MLPIASIPAAVVSGCALETLEEEVILSGVGVGSRLTGLSELSWVKTPGENLVSLVGGESLVSLRCLLRGVLNPEESATL